MRKIGYLGPPGTFTEAAAGKYSGGDPVELICYANMSLIVSAVEGGEVDEGVVPLENSSEGAVGQVLDLVARTPGIMFRGEVVMNISHNLLVRPGISLERVARILSHPQALAQCRGYLSEKLPGVELMETSSTAGAAGIVAGSAEPWAAVGTELAAANYGLEIAVAGIQDSCENATRFIVLGKSDTGWGDNCKTSLIAATRDCPGALYGILREFAVREINLTRIESRPVRKKLGQYMFFIDLEGHRADEKVSSAIKAIEENSSYFRILGSYPMDMSTVREEGGLSGHNLTLKEARAEIDIVDSQIVELIGIRTRLVEKIGHIKNDPGRVRDEARESEVLRRVRAIAFQKGADPDMIESIYRLMIPRYVSLQKGK